MTHKTALVLGLFLAMALVPAHARNAWKEPAYRIKWRQSGNRIIHGSVCYNYESGSVAHRRCRVQAKGYFKSRCAYYRRKAAKTKRPFNRSFLKKKDMFCFSASQFNPL